MSTRIVTVDEAEAHIHQVLALVLSGQEVLLTKDACPVAKFVPASETQPSCKRRALFGCLKGKITIADDFDAPLPDFEAYMQ